jgi:hypothetical protein
MTLNKRPEDNRHIQMRPSIINPSAQAMNPQVQSELLRP